MCRASTPEFDAIPQGRFFLIDLSSLGTTLNGRHVPRGYDEDEGSKRENGVETPMPDQARIGLAETVYLDFRMVRCSDVAPVGAFRAAGGDGRRRRRCYVWAEVTRRE